MIRASVCLVTVLAACSAASIAEDKPGSQSFATILVAPPYAPIIRLGPEPYSPRLQDRRSLFADRLENGHLVMLRRLKKGEIGNFGGIEWQWKDGPENGGIGTAMATVYFLNSPQLSLRRYTSSKLFTPAKADFARTQQDAIARAWAERIGPDIASPGFGNMTTPWLSIRIPRARFEQMRAERGWDIPVNLTLQFSDYTEPDLPAIAEDVADEIRSFPISGKLAGPTPDLATFDAIVLRDGCFFIDEDGDNDPLAMFSMGTGVYRDDAGHMAFRSRYSANPKRLARVGTRMQLGFRQDVAHPPKSLIKACGEHPVVLVKSVDQAAGYGGVWFAVKQNADRQGLSERVAMKQANACLIQQESVWADRRLRGSTADLDECPLVFLAPPPPPETE